MNSPNEEVPPVGEVLPSKPKWGKETRSFSVRFPVEMADEIAQAARDAGFSINETMMRLTEWALRQHRADKAKRQTKRGGAR